MANLTTNYLGLELKNPIIIGSSGLTNSVEKIKKLAAYNAGAIVLKSLFEEQILMEMLNSQDYGYPEAFDYARQYTKEKSINDYLTLIEESKKAVNIPIIASVNCVESIEWSSFAKKMELAGADALEINVSLLPSNIEIDSEQNEKKYFDIISEIRKSIKIPIALKMSYYSAGLAQLIQKLSWTKNIDAFVLFNRYYTPDIDINKLEIKSSNIFSSPEDIAISLRWIALMSGKIDLPLVASTGIHDGEAVIKQILAGARAVQIVSTVYKNGEKQIKEILKTLESWMNDKNYESLDKFRGLLNYDKVNNSSSYERIQFMKYYSNLK